VITRRTEEKKGLPLPLRERRGGRGRCQDCVEVGLNLSVVQAQACDIKIASIYRGILPFLIAPLVLLIQLFLFPEPDLMLPRALHG
jgi:hypothetical protein